MRIGLAWDLGAGRGHAVRVATLARRMRERGDEPVLFARNLLRQRTALGNLEVRLLPAPHNDWIPADVTPASWADILWNECGLHDEAQAVALALAWRDVLDASGVQALLVDAAPLAPVAARALGIRCVAIGTGFLVPPPGPPWPVFRTWEAVDSARIAQRERVIAERWHAIQAALGVARHDQIDQGDEQALFTSAQYDHYPMRSKARYVGPMVGHGCAPCWPPGSKRVFVYLQPHPASLELLRERLVRDGDAAVLAHFGGAQPWAAHPRLHVSTQPVDMRATLAQADIVVGHGGNLAVAAALAGKPALLLPTQAEMYLTARRIEALGAAVTLLPPFDARAVDAAWQRLTTLRPTPGPALRDDACVADEVLDLLLPAR